LIALALILGRSADPTLPAVPAPGTDRAIACVK
jgi:hypothetical protein